MLCPIEPGVAFHNILNSFSWLLQRISSRNFRYIVSHDVLDEVAKAVDSIQRASPFVTGHMKRNRVSLLMIHKEVGQADSVFHFFGILRLKWQLRSSHLPIVKKHNELIPTLPAHRVPCAYAASYLMSFARFPI